MPSTAANPPRHHFVMRSLALFVIAIICLILGYVAFLTSTMPDLLPLASSELLLLGLAFLVLGCLFLSAIRIQLNPDSR